MRKSKGGADAVEYLSCPTYKNEFGNRIIGAIFGILAFTGLIGLVWIIIKSFQYNVLI